MNKEELLDLLEETAALDLVEGTDIYDHPCTVASRAINKCFDDISFLKSIIDGRANKQSKKAIYMLKMSYSPDW